MAMASAESTNQLVVESAPGSKTALPMVITLFFLWGFITCLNDILIPHLKSLFTLNYAEVMLVQTFFFTGYFIFALPSGKVIDWIGYKWTMVAGLLVMAVGALCFLPAAMVPSFPLFLVALGIVAAGMTLLQVAANPYVIVLG
ncbi:MAG: MFS transporter, partial [Acidobacteriaceae bacterium]